jgi:PTH2 family peptidyl-tRNA hydrolase
MNVKQVIVIRKDLKMRRGKEIAQGSHASMAWLTRRLVSNAYSMEHTAPEDAEGYLFRPDHGAYFFTEAEHEWITGAFAKVTLQVSSEEELRSIYQKAKNAGLEAHLIIDSGRTEFDGVPTATAVGIGPDEADKINEITGELKLY